MKRTMKRAIAIILTLVILMSVMSIAAFAADTGAFNLSGITSGPLASIISAIKDLVAVINAAKEFINNGMPGLPFGDKA